MVSDGSFPGETLILLLAAIKQSINHLMCCVNDTESMPPNSRLSRSTSYWFAN